MLLFSPRNPAKVKREHFVVGAVCREEGMVEQVAGGAAGGEEGKWRGRLEFGCVGDGRGRVSYCMRVLF